MIVWGGLRGAVTLGLALSLPTELDYWFTIRYPAFGVVLFTLLVQAPTMPWLIKKMGLAGTLPSTRLYLPPFRSFVYKFSQ